jgi:type I restriction enzyme R subunit
MAIIREINHRNILLKHKMSGDERYVRVYKRIDEQNAKRKMDEPFIISKVEFERVEALNKIREQIEEMVYKNENCMENEAFFRKEVMGRISHTLLSLNLAKSATLKDKQEIQRLIVAEYTSQYKQYKFSA